MPLEPQTEPWDPCGGLREQTPASDMCAVECVYVVCVCLCICVCEIYKILNNHYIK